MVKNQDVRIFRVFVVIYLIVKQNYSDIMTYILTIFTFIAHTEYQKSAANDTNDDDGNGKTQTLN